MRDTTVNEDDLALVVAKQKLATIREHPRYALATRARPISRGARIALFAGTGLCGGLAYACSLYVTAAWLMWFLVVVFGGLALLLLFAQIGFAQKIDHWGAAVVGKRIAGTKHIVMFLAESGEQREFSVAESLYELVRLGDIGVVSSSGSGEYASVESFDRL